jgi:hypothetical protein
VTLTAVNAISDMVAPVVLLTVGGMLSNGLITIYKDIDNRMRDMTRERLQIRRGPAGRVLDPAILLGLGVAAMSLAKSADAITYAVKRTTISADRRSAHCWS